MIVWAVCSFLSASPIQFRPRPCCYFRSTRSSANRALELDLVANNPVLTYSESVQTALFALVDLSVKTPALRFLSSSPVVSLQLTIPFNLGVRGQASKGEDLDLSWIASFGLLSSRRRLTLSALVNSHGKW